MSHRGRRPRMAVGRVLVSLLSVAIAACSHQNRYAPPEPVHCAQRVICAGDGGRLDHAGQTCRCARLVDYDG